MVLPGSSRILPVFQSDPGMAGHDHPVFGPAGVLLIAQTLAGQDLEALHLEAWSFIQNGKVSPWNAELLRT